MARSRPIGLNITVSKLIWLMLPCMLCAGMSYAAHKTITLQQAESLAEAAAEPTGVTKLQGFALELDSGLIGFPDFYFFSAYVAVPGAQGTSGHFAVNKFTGDVWDPFGCYPLSNPKLMELQKELRKDLGVTLGEYRKLQKKDPCLV
jgi:hypothetical protein